MTSYDPGVKGLWTHKEGRREIWIRVLLEWRENTSRPQRPWDACRVQLKTIASPPTTKATPRPARPPSHTQPKTTRSVTRRRFKQKGVASAHASTATASTPSRCLSPLSHTPHTRGHLHRHHRHRRCCCCCRPCTQSSSSSSPRERRRRAKTREEDIERKFPWIVAVLLIAVTHLLSAANVSIAVPEDLVGAVLVRCSFSPLLDIKGGINLKVTKSSSNKPIVIYNSYGEDSRPDVATFVGDLAKGDCSLLLPNDSRGSVIDFSFQFYNASRLNATLSVVEAPQTHSGAGGTTVAAAAETSPTAGPHFRGWTGIGAAVVVAVVVVVVAVVIFIQKRRRSSGSSPGSHSGDGQADVHGDVEENGHPLMVAITNGPTEANGDGGTIAA
uniref:Uncharacterized protein LOC116957523 n=1 Tax=Petromyzon marinus TaxID=7757 RepID=A0AAJ7XI65_PETMA|nr:uncharacterized protein LOC116957523 [Petromyzon marinus]